jgi:hypothetical protein
VKGERIEWPGNALRSVADLLELTYRSVVIEKIAQKCRKVYVHVVGVHESSMACIVQSMAVGTTTQVSKCS